MSPDRSSKKITAFMMAAVMALSCVTACCTMTDSDGVSPADYYVDPQDMVIGGVYAYNIECDMDDLFPTYAQKAKAIDAVLALLSNYGIKMSGADIDFDSCLKVSVQRTDQYDYRLFCDLDVSVNIGLTAESDGKTLELRDGVVTFTLLSGSDAYYSATKVSMDTSFGYKVTFSGSSNFINQDAGSLDDLIKVSDSFSQFSFDAKMIGDIGLSLRSIDGYVLPKEGMYEYHDAELISQYSIKKTDSDCKSLRNYLKSFEDKKGDVKETVKFIVGYSNGICTSTAGDESAMFSIGKVFKDNSDGSIVSFSSEQHNFRIMAGISPLTHAGAMTWTAEAASFEMQMRTNSTVLTVTIGEDSTDIDLTDMMNRIFGDINYGMNVVLTEEEVQHLDSDMAVNAQYLDMDIVGYGGKNLNSSGGNSSISLIIIAIIALIAVAGIVLFAAKRKKA